jgi:hypothetical protein
MVGSIVPASEVSLLLLVQTSTAQTQIKCAKEILRYQRRKRIEECFGWIKDIALLRKLKHRGLFKVGWIFTFAAAAYNLVRLRNLISIQAAA